MTIEKLNNCPNCDGILDDAGRCIFCGSKVYDFLTLSFDNQGAKTYIRIKVGNKIGILPVYFRNANYTTDRDSYYADMYDGGIYMHKIQNYGADLEVNFRVFDDAIWIEEEQDGNP